MKWKGRPTSKNVSNRTSKSAFTKGGQEQYAFMQPKIVARVAAKKAYKKLVEKKKTIPKGPKGRR